MDTSIAQENKITAEVSSCVPASASSDWIKTAFPRNPRKKRKVRHLAIWEVTKPAPFTLSECLAELAPAAPKVSHQPKPASEAVRAMRAWYQHWEARNWTTAGQFLRASDIDDQPTHPILHIATDLGNF